MKPGVYTVRGTIGPGVSEPVSVSVYHTDILPEKDRPNVPEWRCGFAFRGETYIFRPRPLSPHPERILPRRALIGLQTTVRSIAAMAFKAAKDAAREAAEQVANATRAAEQNDVDLDSIVMSGIARRSMGVSE